MNLIYFQARTAEERAALNAFLSRYNQRGAGSATGYVAYYAAAYPADGRSLPERLVAVAKFCPLHSPQAARFFGGADWRQVYVLQRLAACRLPENGLSQFLAWSLRQMGRDPKVWYVATYADTGTFDPRTQQPHDGGIYRATNAVYCGLTAGQRVEGYRLNGQRRSLRCGPKTVRLSDLPPQAQIIRSRPKQRYCWAVGPPLKRALRRHKLARRMARFRFQAVSQPRLLLRRLPMWSGYVLSPWLK